jgi:hypothetical protein
MVSPMLVVVLGLGIFSVVTGLWFLRIVSAGLGVLYLVLHLHYSE